MSDYYPNKMGNLLITGKLEVTGAVNQEAINSNGVSEAVAANKTLDEGDSGVRQVVTADTKTVTLPATAVGATYIVENGAADGTVAVTISPNASDKIMGNGFTSADNKDAVNTKATAKKGDRMVLVGDGADGWYVQEVVGVWAREA